MGRRNLDNLQQLPDPSRPRASRIVFRAIHDISYVRRIFVYPGIFPNLSTCFSATTSACTTGSLFNGCHHPGFQRRGRSRMQGIATCRIDAKLTQRLDQAMIEIARLEENHSLCPIQASEKLVAAQAAWIEHKVTCRFCCGQQFGRVH